MTLSSKFVKRILVIFVIIVMNLTSLTALASTDVIIVDPTPDTTPPVLTSLSISSNTASPGNPVTITAEVSDDLSGVNQVSIYCRKPSGSTTGISLTLVPTTNKYQGNINIGTYDEAGEWVPSYLTLIDKKSNSGNVYNITSTSSGQKFDFSPYKFTVSGVSTPPVPPVIPEPTDKVPPVLNSISVSTSGVSGPSTVKLIADVSDDDTGVSSVSACYLKPSGRCYYVGLYFSGTTGKYEGSIIIDKYEEIGDWKLDYVCLQDKVGNYKYIYDSTLHPSCSVKQDFSSCKIHVEGITPDLIAPTLDNLAINLIQNTDNTALIKLPAVVSDALSGVRASSVYGVYAKPSGKTIPVKFNWNGTTGKYEASIPIDKYDELGTWKLQNISMGDNKYNDRTLLSSSSSSSVNARDFSPFDFTVRGVITVPPVSPFSIGISPKTITLEPGTSQQLTATLNMTDGTTKDITLGTSGTVYTSSNPSAVKVSSNGLITVEPSAASGTVYVQATNGVLSEQCEVVIPGAISESNLQINPLSVSLSSGQKKQLNVIESLADGTVKDVTLGSTGTKYSSSDTSIVTVDSNGLIQVLAEAKPGTATIQVDNNGVTGECAVTVTGPPTVKALTMTPATATVSYGETIQLSARATMTDGSSKDVTNGSNGTVYTTSNSSKATVNENGLISIPATATSGTVTVKATNNDFTALCAITVNGVPTISDIAINPTSKTLMPGDTSQINVSATMSDGTKKDITNSSEGTTYVSNNTSVATVDANGLITVLSTATAGYKASITATNGGKSVSCIVTVDSNVGPTINNLSIDPTAITLGQGEQKQLVVTGSYADSTTKDITNSSEGTTYTSSNTEVATVDENGLITVLSTATAGYKTSITVNNGGKSASCVVTVATTVLSTPSSLTIDPTTITLGKGEQKQLAVTGFYTDGTTTDITNNSEGTTYTSSNTAVATVDDNGLITVLSTASAGAKAVVTAKNNGKTASCVVTVSPTLTIPSTMTIDPATALMTRGEQKQLAVTATLGDGTTKDITNSSESTTYTSSNTAVATVDANGLVTVLPTATIGYKTVIAAKNSGKTVSCIITAITGGTAVTSVAINPTSVTLGRGEQQQLVVTGTLGDGTTKDITNSSEGTTYISSNTTVATVDANGLVTVLPTATLGYKSVITAKNNSKSVSCVVTAGTTGVTISSLSVSPKPASIAKGATQQLVVTATMSDGSTKDVTNSSEGTTYTSSNTALMTVDANGLVTVLPTATVGYKSVITAKNGTRSASSTATVTLGGATVSSISSNFLATTLAKGTTQQLIITATMSDGTTKDVTNSSEGTIYTSSNTALMTVDANGLITVLPTATVGYKSAISIKNNGKVLSCIVTVGP